MAKAGRKRKSNAPRYQNGKAKSRPRYERRDDIRRTVMEQRRRIVGADKVLDQRAGFPLGVYELRGQITADERRAGEKYAELVMAVRRDYDVPRPDAKSNYPSDMLSGFGRRHADETMTDEQLRQEREARADRLKRYNRAFEALQNAGRRANRSVNRVAVNDRFIDDNDLSTSASDLKAGLRALALHFGYVRA